jgi:SWI/SNF-related matrix-associated actin-dependent regulator of chromatin subfamily D
MVGNPAQYQQQPAVNHQQLQAQAAAEAQRRDEEKRRERRQAKKPTDLELPEGIEDVVIGDAPERYRKLREIERRLDATMMRKKLEMQDQTQRNDKRARTMRIWISNTAENQPWQNTSMDPDAFDFADSSQATYKVQIEGRLLDADDGLEEEEAREHAPHIQERTRFSHFFKSITIDFDRPPSLQPDGMAQIEWKRPPPDARTGLPNTTDAANFDFLKFERKSDENINVQIKLYRDENPERFRLSPALAELCDTLEDDRPGVMHKLWTYIRQNKLQESEDVRVIRCDGPLKKVGTIFQIKISPTNYPHRLSTMRLFNSITSLTLYSLT